MRTFQVAATVEGISTLKDGGLSVRLHTQELTNDQKTLALNYQGQFGWFLFKETEFKDDDTKELEAIRRDTGGKSPSQRLRGALYVMYTQRGDTSTTFEQFYSQQMEKIINSVKSNLD